MIYEKAVVLPKPFNDALDQVKKTFTAEGLEILNEIDMQVFLSDSVDKEVERFVIVTVCNPDIARRALDVDPLIAVLLPCNVVVRELDDKVLVEVMNPGLMASVSGIDEMTPIAGDARHLVHEALSQLHATALV